MSAARALAPNPTRMFGGGSASYADIAGGLTFERTPEADVRDQLIHGKVQFASIVGAAGVGKSSCARRLLLSIMNEGFPCFEHIDEFPFAWESWLEVAHAAQETGRHVFLLIDDAPRHLTGINRLANRLTEENVESLSLVLTAHSASWTQRSRSGQLRRHGREDRLESLDEREVDALVALIRTSEDIRALLEPSVDKLTRDEQLRLVQQRSRADMFVALKFLFASEALDTIILEEFAQLPEDVQEVYKVAALLEATYAHASRQMILEVLNLDWSDVPLVLDRTKGVLQQKVVDARDGTYVWRTRHPVIAQVIAKYKYVDQDELYFVLKRIVDCLNSAMLVDRYIVPNLCDTDWGIGRLQDSERQIRLLETLAKRSSNRVPWHRLITIWLSRDLTTAEGVIRRAVNAVGVDSPIARFQVRLTLMKAEDLRRLGTDDYIALILDAEAKAKDAIRRWPDNKYSYLSLLEVGEALLNANGNARIVGEAVDEISDAYDSILDEQMLRWRQRGEAALSRT